MKRFILLFIVSLFSVCGSCQVFSVLSKYGELVYYNIISKRDKTVEVQSAGRWRISPEKVFVPSSIDYEGVEYTVVRIGNNAFSGKASSSPLKRIDLPQTITSIGESAFNWCELLTITIPQNCTEIEDKAFYSCGNLTYLSIPSSVKIGYEAFDYCRNLTEINTPSLSNWCAIQLSTPFPRKFRLLINDNEIDSSVIIPNGVEEIGKYAFYNCESVYTMLLPETVRFIGIGAFNYCSNLSSINIPKSVIDIEGNIFSGCSLLDYIYWEPNETLDLGTAIQMTFSIENSEAELHLHKNDKNGHLIDGIIRNLKKGSFKKIVIEDSTPVNSIKLKELKNNVLYNLQGQIVISPIKGQLYIINGKKVIYN